MSDTQPPTRQAVWATSLPTHTTTGGAGGFFSSSFLKGCGGLKCKGFKEMFEKSFPACAFFKYNIFKETIRSCAPVPVSMPVSLFCEALVSRSHASPTTLSVKGLN